MCASREPLHQPGPEANQAGTTSQVAVLNLPSAEYVNYMMILQNISMAIANKYRFFHDGTNRNYAKETES